MRVIVSGLENLSRLIAHKIERLPKHTGRIDAQLLAQVKKETVRILPDQQPGIAAVRQEQFALLA